MKMNLQKLKMQNAKRLFAKRKNNLVPPLMPPRYDEVYFEGLKWLDSLAGEKTGRRKINV